jgi:hypothetical protein
MHEVRTSSPPMLNPILVPAIKLMITADSIMVAKLATTPSLNTCHSEVLLLEASLYKPELCCQMTGFMN